MMRLLLILAILLQANELAAQKKNFYKEYYSWQKNYVDSHEVVKQDKKQYFRFFAPDKNYRVTASLTRLVDTLGFFMKTSGTKHKKFYRYGLLNFRINGHRAQLTVYQSEQLRGEEEYKDYLFLPFTDLSSGEDSYGGGRYLDLLLTDIKNGKLLLDFNRAYNPYCAYSTGFNCPIPPRENDLRLLIKAGEKDFAAPH